MSSLPSSCLDLDALPPLDELGRPRRLTCLRNAPKQRVIRSP